MTEKRWHQFLRTLRREDLPRHIDHHEREARRTTARGTAKSRAEHAMKARHFREELARREALTKEARTVIGYIQGEPAHAPLFDILHGALAVHCDTALEAGLEMWLSTQLGNGPLPRLDVQLTHIGGIAIRGLNRRLRALLWGTTGDDHREHSQQESAWQPAENPARQGPVSGYLTDAEKTRLRARAPRAKREEMGEEEAAD